MSGRGTRAEGGFSVSLVIDAEQTASFNVPYMILYSGFQNLESETTAPSYQRGFYKQEDRNNEDQLCELQ